MASNSVPFHVVTGAFGYSGRYIAERLLDKGFVVKTLTNSPNRPNPFQGTVEAMPFHFDEPDRLVEFLRGAEVVYNTYWVRFNAPQFKHSEAVTNTLRLFEAARKAGVRRFVHVSITNPSKDSNLEYFRGKAVLEEALVGLGLPYTILRPAVIFGREDILINNIAWVLRHLPVFGVFGDGNYRLQPIHVEDLADLAVAAAESSDNKVIDAIGPETFSYRELATQIGRIIGHKRPIVSVRPSLGFAAGWLVGKLVRDTVITREEIDGLMQDLLCTDSPPAGQRRLTDWARTNAETLGKHYASEMSRRIDRTKPYLDWKS